MQKLVLMSEEFSRNSQGSGDKFSPPGQEVLPGSGSPEDPPKNSSKLREKFKQQSHSRISIKELIQKDVTPIYEQEEDEGEQTGPKSINDSLELHKKQ